MSRKLFVLLLAVSFVLAAAPIWAAQDALVNITPAFEKFGQTQLIAQAFVDCAQAPGVDVTWTGVLPWGDTVFTGPIFTGNMGKAKLGANNWPPHVYRVQATGDFLPVDSTGSAQVPSQDKVLTIYSPTVPQIAIGASFSDWDSPCLFNEISLGFIYQFNGVVIIPKKILSGCIDLRTALIHEFQIVDHEEDSETIRISAIDFKSAALYYDLKKWQLGPLKFTGLCSYKVGDNDPALYPFRADICFANHTLLWNSRSCLTFKMTVFLPQGRFYCTPILPLNPCDFSLSLAYDDDPY